MIIKSVKSVRWVWLGKLFRTIACTRCAIKIDQQLVAVTSSKFDRFSKFVHHRNDRRTFNKIQIYFPPHLKSVAALPRVVSKLKVRSNLSQFYFLITTKMIKCIFSFYSNCGCVCVCVKHAAAACARIFRAWSTHSRTYSTPVHAATLSSVVIRDSNVAVAFAYLSRSLIFLIISVAMLRCRPCQLPCESKNCTFLFL